MNSPKFSTIAVFGHCYSTFLIKWDPIFVSYRRNFGFTFPFLRIPILSRKTAQTFQKFIFFRIPIFVNFPSFFLEIFPFLSIFLAFCSKFSPRFPFSQFFSEFRKLHFPFYRIPILSRKITQPKQCQIPILSNSHFIKKVLYKVPSIFKCIYLRIVFYL